MTVSHAQVQVFPYVQSPTKTRIGPALHIVRGRARRLDFASTSMSWSRRLHNTSALLHEYGHGDGSPLCAPSHEAIAMDSELPMAIISFRTLQAIVAATHYGLIGHISLKKVFSARAWRWKDHME